MPLSLAYDGALPAVDPATGAPETTGVWGPEYTDGTPLTDATDRSSYSWLSADLGDVADGDLLVVTGHGRASGAGSFIDSISVGGAPITIHASEGFSGTNNAIAIASTAAGAAADVGVGFTATQLRAAALVGRVRGAMPAPVSSGAAHSTALGNQDPLVSLTGSAGDLIIAGANAGSASWDETWLGVDGEHGSASVEFLSAGAATARITSGNTSPTVGIDHISGISTAAAAAFTASAPVVTSIAPSESGQTLSWSATKTDPLGGAVDQYLVTTESAGVWSASQFGALTSYTRSAAGEVNRVWAIPSNAGGIAQPFGSAVISYAGGVTPTPAGRKKLQLLLAA